EVADCRIDTLWRLIGVEPEVVQCAPADRIRVLVLCERFAVPCYRIGSLSNTPRCAAVALIVERAIVRPAGFLRRRMKANVTKVHPRSEGHAKGLDRAIQVHVVKSVLIVPDPN